MNEIYATEFVRVEFAEPHVVVGIGSSAILYNHAEARALFEAGLGNLGNKWTAHLAPSRASA